MICGRQAVTIRLFLNFTSAMKHSTLFACLVLASSAAAAAPQGKTNEALSFCVKEALERDNDRKVPVDDAVQTIWQACDGDHAQAVAENPTMADILKLRIRAMVTGRRNASLAKPPL